MIELLIQYGSKFESFQAQKFAIEKRDAQLLSYLFRAWDNLVPANKLGESGIHVINDCHIDWLDVLVSYNSLNKVFPVNWGRDVQRERLLRIACRTARSKQ